MRSRFRRITLCVFISCALSAQSRLRLKTAERSESTVTAPAQSRSAGRYHVLAQPGDEMTPSRIGELRQGGVRFVQYVPDDGFVLSVPPDFEVEGSGLLWAERVHVDEKLSPALADESIMAGQEHLVVELYPDVDPQVGRGIARDLGYEVVDHPDLIPNHLLLRAGPEAAARLAEWDEIAYVFPASRDLAAGERVVSCPGALTAAGSVGQYVASVGDGWDGPGRGSVRLGFFFKELTQRLPGEQVRAELVRALSEWSRVASLSFSEADSPVSHRTLTFLFASGDHGDGYPFDGQGRVLAHTFYPSPPNPESIAGDLHLDEDEEWVIGPDLSVRSVDLFSVSLHELGHALGLGHSDVPGAVMYPYYRRATSLTAEDVNAILRLYAAPGTNPGPNPAPPVAPPKPAGDTVAPTLKITSPAATSVLVSSPRIRLLGTASDNVGVSQVTWSTSFGRSGVATGTSYWNTGDIPLLIGTNVVVVRARDAAGNSSWRSVTVTRR